MKNIIKASILNMAVLATLTLPGNWAHAQFPGMPQPKHYAWSDPKLSPDARADLVIKEMTLAEKILLLHGQGLPFFSSEPPESNGGAGFTKPIPRLGIPAVQMADSAYGVTQGSARGRYSTALPNNLATASSWDPQVAFEYGKLIGRELRNEGYSMSLAGGVNLTREPRDGRTFEYQGEDPLLAGTMAGNFAKGVQSQHVIGDLKHYAINDQESGREAVNAIIDKRAMRETDLLAFQIALGVSDAGAVMCSYNRVNGDYACENQYLLGDVLKKDFGFKGFVMSDWGGTHSTVKASHAGLDQEEPGAKCVDMIPIAAISPVRQRRWPWVCVLERGVRWFCRAIVQDRRQTLLCQAVAYFLQLAGDPQSLDIEASIDAIKHSANGH